MDAAELKSIIQAVIYVADAPVTLEQFQEVFPDLPLEELTQAIEKAQGDFNQSQQAMEIREIAGGYRMSTRPEHHEWIRAYLKTKPAARLSLAALETLSVV